MSTKKVSERAGRYVLPFLFLRKIFLPKNVVFETNRGINKRLEHGDRKGRKSGRKFFLKEIKKRFF